MVSDIKCGDEHNIDRDIMWNISKKLKLLDKSLYRTYQVMGGLTEVYVEHAKAFARDLCSI